jgi:hypothetical protein
MKRQTILFGIITSLTLLSENVLPVQAQKTTVNQPNYNLIYHI